MNDLAETKTALKWIEDLASWCVRKAHGGGSATTGHEMWLKINSVSSDFCWNGFLFSAIFDLNQFSPSRQKLARDSLRRHSSNATASHLNNIALSAARKHFDITHRCFDDGTRHEFPWRDFKHLCISSTWPDNLEMSIHSPSLAIVFFAIARSNCCALFFQLNLQLIVSLNAHENQQQNY